jgi:hypothetical protein
MFPAPLRLVLSVGTLLALSQPSFCLSASAAELDLSQIRMSLPTSAEGYAQANPQALAKRTRALAAEAFDGFDPRTVAQRGEAAALAQLRGLIQLHRDVEDLLDDTLALRTQFVAEELAAAEGAEPADVRPAIRNYLRTCQALISLSGRLRYLIHDILQGAVTLVQGNPQRLAPVVAQLTEAESSIGAIVLAPYLLTHQAVKPLSRAPDGKLQGQMIRLAAAAREPEMLPQLVKFLRDKRTSTDLKIRAAAAVKQIGLPQPPRGDEPKELPKPPITPQELYDQIAKLNVSKLPADMQSLHAQLVTWADERRQQGIVGDTYRLGRMDLKAGDWLLMRNPSPYNLFTDLAPGLFTHVGVAAWETGSDGIRRMILVDLPERGTTMPATNVDTFVQRTLHYVFLRHRDPAVAVRMGEIAASLVGNETEFDLNFRTDRLNELHGKDLKGQKITTYCAGLLLLCAMESGLQRGDVFPLTEEPSQGHTRDNIGKLGLSVGANFVSPTGALFSPQLELIGRREPMYEATREIEENIYDHFADRLAGKTLVPSPDWSQTLREKLAEASKWNSLLAQALAAVAGVNENTDLVAAARAGAVVETLDEIALGASADYTAAREAVRASSDQALFQGRSRSEASKLQALRKRHSDLARRWSANQISPRRLREELVTYYAARGCKQLDDRFFREE